MLKRWRNPLVLGALAITACFALELTAIVLGAAVAGSIAVVLDPLAGILIASAIVLVLVGVVRRRRRKGTRCDAAGCDPKADQ